MKIFTQNKTREEKRIKIVSIIGVFAFSLFIASCAIYLYSPVIGTHADESLNTRVMVDVYPVVSLMTDVSEIDFNITPTSAGTFDSDSIIATVSTNSLGGYELYFSSEDNSTDMTHLDSSINDVITSDFNGTVTSSTMAANKWGYSLDNTNFSKIPTLASHAIIRNLDHLPSTTEKNTTVYIGTKISTALTSGSYTKRVKFSVVAHENPGPSLFEIDDMQEMTSEVCAETTTPNASATSFDWDGSHKGDKDYVPRKSLRDSRDGNYYLVSKLADGNCWMSQNLALDLTANTPIIASNNDSTTMSVTPNSTTQTTPGLIAWANDDNWRSYHPPVSESYYRAGYTMSSTPSGSGVAYDWEKAGNYYNWYAATAGTGTKSLTETEAESSICPKGWRLPPNTGTKSYVNLISTTYNVSSSTDGSSRLRTDPLNFILGGFYDVSYNSMRAQGGKDGYDMYWSSTSTSSWADYAHILFYSKATVSPNNYNSKMSGFSVRCVAI